MTTPAECNGWRLYQHPAFAARFDGLLAEVERLAARDPDGYVDHPKAKPLRRIVDLILTEIPRAPAADIYALGNTLGPAHRHWRRAKFLGRFRLFFRFHSGARAIVYAWVSDETTLRKAGSRRDPYATFARLLAAGDPPDGWDDLMRRARPVRRP